MQCSRVNWKLRVAAQLLAAGVFLAAPFTRVHAQGPTGFSPGLVDTLIAIAGAPRAFSIARPAEGPSYLGTYNFKEDSITLSPVMLYVPRHVPALYVSRSARISPDWVLSHEFGHRLDYLLLHAPCIHWLGDARFKPAGNEYANHWNGQERFAEAFANAIDILRLTGLEVPPELESVLEQREWYVPGTGDLVGVLLRHPVYRDHPLNKRTRGGSSR